MTVQVLMKARRIIAVPVVAMVVLAGTTVRRAASRDLADRGTSGGVPTRSGP
ncbi:hypothetical protein [Micromonospora violae]|uniref:hypothetical protein n=1 Tax=Micromonospora violae TaxID=1278207 RepID=UPI0013EEF2FA|nr:hypothetical protein [Micromonospora violae]